MPAFRHSPGGLEVADEVAECRSEETSGTGVDQHQPGAGIDQERIDRRLDGIGEERALEQLVDAHRRGVGQELAYFERKRAVGQRHDFKIAEHHAVVAGRLALLLWRRCVKRGRREQSGGDGGDAGNELAQSIHDVPPRR
jgi:hypothetical protein